MKYFVYAYNYVTLHKAITYAREEWGIENTFFIYTTSNATPPEALLKGQYQHCIIDPETIEATKISSFFSYVKNIIIDKRIVQRFVDYITKNCNEENVAIVVFRDTNIRESILIEEIKKRYSNAVIILIEEGLAIYATPESISFSFRVLIKKFLFKMLGIPTISLKKLPHGNNPNTDIIICSRPQALIVSEANKKIKILKEKDVFSKENCDYFLCEVMKKELSKKTFEFVFLSQPLFPQNNDQANKKYDAFLKQLFELTSRYGKLVIKPHPSDSWNYTKYLTEKVEMCPQELTKCAYEIVVGYFGNPQAITLYSSAALNGKTTKPPIFLYEFFPELIRPDIFTERFIKDNDIVKCKTMKDVDATLCENYNKINTEA